MTSPISPLGAALDPTIILPTERLGDYAVEGVTPSLVVRPRSVGEVRQVLAEAHREEAAVVPWGGGTRMALGAPPRAYHLALDLTGIDQPLEHSPADMTARVGAGTTLERLQGALRQHGQFLPLDAPLPQRATIGGILASSTYGPLCAGYGFPRDMVIGMGVVHADGTLTRSGGQVVKNVTGYEMHRLYTGSLGTLAVIVEATFKVAPLPREERTVVAAFPSAEGAIGAGLAVVRAGLAPMAVEVLTDPAWQLVPASALPLAPEERKAFWLLLRFGGPPPAVARQERDALAICQRFGVSLRGVEILAGEGGRALWRAVADLGSVEPQPPLCVRLSALPSQGVHLLALVEEVGAALPPGPALALHASIGVVRALWPAGPGLDAPQKVAPVLRALRERAHALGARMIVERASPPVKLALNPWDAQVETMQVQRSLKAQFDPKGILNPGRFVGGI
ncbi:MAG: FAD-binding oxidoreductase [Dehalococcoidia bacterium]